MKKLWTISNKRTISKEVRHCFQCEEQKEKPIQQPTFYQMCLSKVTLLCHIIALVLREILSYNRAIGHTSYGHMNGSYTCTIVLDNACLYTNNNSIYIRVWDS